MVAGSAVAVIGLSCRFPGAGDALAYWAALRAGTEGISRFTVPELVARGVEPDLARRPDFVAAKGVLAGGEAFDWSLFGYSRAEAASIDPQQRVFLECAAAALDDAGIDPTRFAGWIGVYAGADTAGPRPDGGLGELAGYIGREKDFLSSRVAYKLGLRGPAVTVQTACSTSLTAIHLAARSLLGDECDVALAGGVTVTPGSWGYLYEDGGILSPDGHCRPFDAAARGTVPSEGVGIVVLKRLADALRDEDRIAAVLLGSAVNNDGGEKVGFTAPSIPGQAAAIRQAQRVAAVDPADIDYVEAHATATPMGDPVEVQALTDVFQAGTRATGWCRLGGVKSNLGHTGAAAGVASFIKTVLMLEHRELVPTLHFTRPNPLLELAMTPFTVATRTEPWPDRGRPLAAVSAFGVGGTNAHAVLAGPPPRPTLTRPTTPQVLAVSAGDPRGLERARTTLAAHLERARPPLPDAAVTLAGRRPYRHRHAVLAADHAAAVTLLREPGPAAAAGLDRVAFLLPGQGVLRHAAGAAAYGRLVDFRAGFDEIRDAVRTRCAVDLTPVVDEGAASAEMFADTVLQQLGLFALGYALGRQLESWGVRPAALLGNSVGEYAAAALAGVWAPADAAALVHARAQAMWATPPGLMAAVDAPAAEVDRRLGSDHPVTVAVFGTHGVVLSGPAAAMAELLDGDRLAGLAVHPLTNQRAFHTAGMEAALPALAAAVAATPARPPRVRLIANSTGGWAEPAAVCGPDYWTGQLRRPVRLADAAGTLLRTDCDLFVELGPGASLIGTLRRHRDWKADAEALPLLGRPGDGELPLLRAAAALWRRGADEALTAVTPGSAVRRCSLPPRPFAGRDPADPGAAAPRVGSGPAGGGTGPAGGGTGPAGPARSGRPDRSPPTASSPGSGAGESLRDQLAAQWCAVLGTRSAADSDDFLALGGESFLAVNLISLVRQRIGVAVPVAAFLRDPRFASLVTLATAAGGPVSLPAGTVGAPAILADTGRLSEGTGRPVFLMADATGTAAGYQALAAAWRSERPLYGLEQTGPDRTSVAGLATRHVAELRRVQPRGPYTVGGWSFGATVAHAVADLLIAAGERVDTVVGLDGQPPARPGRPVGVDPAYLAACLRLRCAVALGVGPLGRRLRRTPQLRRRFIANLGALLRYRPPALDCAAVLLPAATGAGAAARLGARSAVLYRAGVRVHPVAGDHWSMLAVPHVRDLARQLDEALVPGEPAPDEERAS